MERILILAGATAMSALLAAPAMAQEDGQLVKVSLKEWDLGFQTVKVDGEKARFEIVNDGEYTHSFEIEGEVGGQGVEFRVPDLKPGESTSFTVELPKGNYEVYCPIDGHEDKRMKGTVAFAGE